MDEAKNIKAMLALLSSYLQVPITDMQLLMYAKELEHDGADFVLAACSAVKKSSQGFYGKFPTPAQLRQAVYGEDEDYALESALKIISAVAKFGWPDPNGARAFIGSLGWDVVKAYGGWTTVCRSIDEPEKIGIFQSQFQKTAKMLIGASRRPRRDGASLASPETRKQVYGAKETPVSIGSVLGRIVPQDQEPQERDSQAGKGVASDRQQGGEGQA